MSAISPLPVPPSLGNFRIRLRIKHAKKKIKTHPRALLNDLNESKTFMLLSTRNLVRCPEKFHQNLSFLCIYNTGVS